MVVLDHGGIPAPNPAQSHFFLKSGAIAGLTIEKGVTQTEIDTRDEYTIRGVRIAFVKMFATLKPGDIIVPHTVVPTLFV